MSARVTRSAVKKNPKLLKDVTSPKNTPGKPRKLVMDKENQTPNKPTATPKSKTKTTPKKSTKKATPKKSTKKATPKKTTKKKSSTPKSSEKKAKKTTTKKKTTPKKTSAKKAAPKSSTKKKTVTPKASKKKATTPKSSTKKATPKSSEKKTRKAPTARKSPAARKSPQAKQSPKAKKTSLSEKVASLSKKIESDDVTVDDLSGMFQTATPTTASADPKSTDTSNDDQNESEYVMVDGAVNSEDMHANVTEADSTETTETTETTEKAASTGSSSDLTCMTICSLLSYAAGHYLPSFAKTRFNDEKYGPIENPAFLSVALICSVIFAFGFRFAVSWSSSKEKALQVLRVSFGLATILVGSYIMFDSGAAQFQQTLTITVLGFSTFELIHCWQHESVGGYFRIAITAMISFWSINMLMLDASSKSLVEYNCYVLCFFYSFPWVILSATGEVHAHLSVGAYLATAVSIYVWAILNHKIPTQDMLQPIKIGVLTFAPTFLAILDQLKPKA